MNEIKSSFAKVTKAIRSTLSMKVSSTVIDVLKGNKFTSRPFWKGKCLGKSPCYIIQSVLLIFELNKRRHALSWIEKLLTLLSGRKISEKEK